MGRRNRAKPQKAHDTNIPTDAAVGQKRDRVNDSDTTDNTNTSRPLKNKKDVWKVDFRYPGDQRNVMLEEYYKMQVFFNKDHPFHQQQHSACPVKVEDWGACYETLKQPLPMAYRINSAHPDRDSVRALLEKEMYNAGFLTQGSQVIDDMITTNGSDNGSGIPCSATIQSPTPCKGTALDENDTVSGVVVTLEYVPNRLAFQADLSRGELKRLPAFKHLKRVVAALNDAGMLTRQEAVSMIPPLLLDVRPGMSVLDMCAAPGSKTSQLLEAMVSGEYRARPSRPKSEGMVCLAYDDNNEGCVVANDVNISRIDILTHQTNRAPSAHPFLVITNNDATTFPLFRNNEDKFDRVLCDVMCSGDGTLRKSADLWTRWNPLQGASLHQAQLQTLLRGMSLVKKGGIVVYSTCSMNPVEDEAVIASALLESGGAFELIDKDEMPDNKGNDDDCMMYGKEECNGILNGLRYSKGIVDWSLMNRDGTLVFDTFADAMSHRQEVMKGKGFQYYSTMFPPHKRDLPPKATSPNSSTSTTVDTTATTTTMPNISKQVINNENYHTDPLHLSRCIRVLPHQQNTGGFFIAALRCIRDYNVEDNAKKRAKSKHERAIAINKAAEVPRVNTDAHDAEAIVHKEEVVGGRDVSHDHTANNNNNTHAYDKPPLFYGDTKDTEGLSSQLSQCNRQCQW